MTPSDIVASSANAEKKVGIAAASDTLITAPAKPPNEKTTYLICFPDYTATNPYQNLLYSECPPDWSWQFGDIDRAIDLIQVYPSAKVIFHLHWPEPIFGGVEDADSFRLRAYVFLCKLEQFKVLGGSAVWTIHNKLPHDRTFEEQYRWLYGELSNAADLIHLHSPAAEGVVGEVTAISPRKCLFVPHGSYSGHYPDFHDRTSARAFLGIEDDAFVVAVIGQLRPYKGIETLYSAFGELRSSHPKLELLIAGRPVHPTKPGHWAALALVTPGLHVVEGHIPDRDLQLYFHAADVVALPYHDILTSGSAMAAIAFGKPLIVPDLPTLGDLVEAGCAFSFARDDVKSLSAVLQRVAAEPQALATTSAKARALSEALPWSRSSKMFFDGLKARAVGQLPTRTLRDCPVTFHSRGPDVPAGAIGVAILTHGSADDVLALLDTLPTESSGVPVKPFILDNTGDPVEVNRLVSQAVQAFVASTPINTGYAEGNNILFDLMAEEDCEIYVVLNPDICLDQNALDQLVETLRENPRSVVSPVVVTEERTVYSAGSYLRRGGGVMEWSARYQGDTLNRIPQEPYEADVLSGCALSFTQEIRKVLGDIPVDYFLYFEETDWLLQAREKGITCKVEPRSVVTHSRKSHGDKAPSLYYVYYLLRNALIFNERFGFSIEATIEHYERSFIRPWLAKLKTQEPRFVRVFERCVSAALKDGQARVSGRVDIGMRMDHVYEAEPCIHAGFIEFIADGKIGGWSSATSESNAEWSKTGLCLVIDDFLVLTAETDQPREDVAQAGYALKTGFILQVPFAYCDMTRRSVQIFEAGSGKRLLSTSGLSVINARIAKAPNPSRSLRGYIDNITHGVLRGWVADNNNPGRTVTVDIEINNEKPFSIMADQYRSDLEKSGIGRGFHSFSVALPSRLLLASELKVKLLVPGTADAVIAQRKINVPMDTYGYSVGFTLDEFLQWSFIENSMPIGAFEKSDPLREMLELNYMALALTPLPDDMPVVSVIMPVFNRESLVVAAIESVVNQSYRNFELIIVDDGSRDNSVAIVEEALVRLADDRIRLIRLPSNRGVSAARNAGMAEARGTYFAYLDSDNTWYSRYLHIMLARFSAQPGYVSAYAGQEIWEHLPAFGMLDRRWVRLCPFNRSRLEKGNYIDLNVFMHHRSLYESKSGFREDMRRLVDWELILRYTEKQPPLFVPALLCRYNVNLASNQITTVESFMKSLNVLRVTQISGKAAQ